MDDRMFDPTAVSDRADLEAGLRGRIGREILGFMAPHIQHLRERESEFLQSLVYRRACLQSTGEEFTLTPKQFKWILRIAYMNGFRANDEAFWGLYRELALSPS